MRDGSQYRRAELGGRVSAREIPIPHSQRRERDINLVG
jgi:hypothetical protein